MTPQEIQRRTQWFALACGICSGVGYLAYRIADGMIREEFNQDTAWLTLVLALHLFIGGFFGYVVGLWLAGLWNSPRVRQLLGIRSAHDHNVAGCAYHAQGANVAAMAELDEAIRIDPKFALAYANRAACWLELERIEEAFADVQEAIRLDPRSPVAFGLRGHLRLARNETDQALADYDEAIRLDPNLPGSLSGRANILLRRGNVQRAQQDVVRCLELDPNHAAGHCVRGHLRALQGDLAGALADYDRAIALGLVSADMFCARGQARLSLDQVDAALADFDHALELAPGQAGALAGRGMAWIVKADFDRALADLEQAMQRGEKSAVNHNNRGFALLQKHHFAEAKADFLEAARLDPKLPNAFKNLAWLQATCPREEFRNGPEAVAHATRALELVEWKDVSWLEILAAAHAEAGNFDEAVRWQEKFLARPPGQSRPESAARLESYQARKPWRETSLR